MEVEIGFGLLFGCLYLDHETCHDIRGKRTNAEE